ncbi:B12-binding domain-containing radical SAM protein [Candidatus Viridilinea mediisalina]|uniref:B12-binding domain-containing radical SAM protein n=1 Tax=Candidatus Viridilinea mediisalina TaxID=2024553 RepID=A0A2A6RI96_9CHLR|nr:radical SAM protein [Candidatus Viridilinea mediisalina]PDW02588.1 B12-binding domain-containing radical SAM protein [Candidatus Viridilinea mediisalina]
MTHQTKLRIALISPRGPLYRHRTGIWKKSMRYMPLTLTTLAALVPPELQAELILVDEGIQEVDLNLQADLIGISMITGTAPRAYELAHHFRQRGVPVVLGGVHATLLPDEAAQYADAVVVGYAEQTWPQLLRDFVAGQMAPRYLQAPNLSLANLPLPRRDLLPTKHYTTPHTIEATRGCIHQCEFCVVPTAWGRHPYQRPVAEVVAEIRHMGTRRLVFLDLNLIADLDYAKALFAALTPLRLAWGGLATTLIAQDEELLDLAARSGCRGLLIGLESDAGAALSETRKSFNGRLDYRELTRRLHERKIALMGCFVFGFDHDDQDCFARTVELVAEARIDLPRYAIQTPFPATPLFRRLEAEGRILTTDWSLYDGQHVVFQPAKLTPEALLRGTEWAWKKTYSYPEIFRRIKASPQLAVALATNLGYRYYAYRLHQFYTCDAPLVAAPSA